MKSIYTYYKERLIEISGKNRSVYTRSFSKKTGYDIGRLLEPDKARENELTDILWSGKKDKFTLIAPSIDSLRKVLGTSVSPAPVPSEITDAEERRKAEAKNARQFKQAFSSALEKEANSVKILKREAEDIEKETGRYELFIGYPFVFGGLKDVLVKAPLLFFPVDVEITESNIVRLSLKKGESVRLNKALVFAYAQAKNIDIQEMDTEFDSLAQSGLRSVDSVLAYLKKFGIRIRPSEQKRVKEFGKCGEPSLKDPLEIKNICLLARYSLSNSIYNDYSELEKSRITSDTIDELFDPHRLRKKKKTQPDDRYFYISDLDYAQRNVVKCVAQSGNMVIYGPPGTGKSQTIVNLISDALCKGKRVLVVSQKKAALDVVYNRLANLSEKAMFIVDPVKERRDFYSKCLLRHEEIMKKRVTDYIPQFDEVSAKLDAEIAKLQEISDTLNSDDGFGISLIDMYYGSFIPGKDSTEYTIYEALLEDKALRAMDYPTLRDAVETLLDHDKLDIYYNFAENKKFNPFIQHLKPDIPIDTLAWARNKLKNLTSSRTAVFDEADYPFARQIIAHYGELNSPRNEKLFIKLLAAFSYPRDYNYLRAGKILFPLYPFAKYKMLKAEKKVRAEYEKTKREIGEFIRDYEFLREVLTYEGYAMALGGILEGNTAILNNLKEALGDYVKVSDMSLSLHNFSEPEKRVLNFAYRMTRDYNQFRNVIVKLLPLRVYHEIINFESRKKNELSVTVEFESIKGRINTLMKDLTSISKKICALSFVNDYKDMYESSDDAKDYLYQISKKQNFWPIRRTMEVYGDYLLTLYPCWLLSPENVSSILPLRKEMFDLVLFDEASQVFIENTVPCIIRGKNVVVAGDAKQLRPTTTFMRRYMGGADDETDLTLQAALEVESLLDLAVARFDSANITYHYRSRSQSLIDFSNRAFYDNRLRISPDVTKSVRNRAIERIKVNGMWSDRKNETEAREIVTVLKKIFKGRERGSTIGIIAFGMEQQSCIEDAIDRESKVNAEFRADILRETNRKEDGQDVSLFIKNIENVQGDERDIIIFSIGYARNDADKVNAHFGSLSLDGGENRLNVAVTRAKKKIYVVTSIEPEDLKVETSKNNGPKLFKTYLAYARAVSNGSQPEIKAVLDGLYPSEESKRTTALTVPVEQQIATKLRSLGYDVDTDLGSGTNKIAVAIYDKKKDRYILGIQVDKTLFNSEETALERDVFACRFLEQKGWNIMRVWSRDWWHNAADVTDRIRKRIDAICGNTAE